MQTPSMTLTQYALGGEMVLSIIRFVPIHTSIEKGMQEIQLRDAEILAIELYIIRHLNDKLIYKRRTRLIKRLKRLQVEKAWDELIDEISDSR